MTKTELPKLTHTEPSMSLNCCTIKDKLFSGSYWGHHLPCPHHTLIIREETEESLHLRAVRAKLAIPYKPKAK